MDTEVGKTNGDQRRLSRAPSTPAAVTISPEIAVKEPNDASDPADDKMIAIFEDHGDDPVLKKRTSFASNPRSEVSESSALSDQVDGLPSLNLWSPPP